jgi:hypothetical protein
MNNLIEKSRRKIGEIQTHWSKRCPGSWEDDPTAAVY